MNNKGSRGEWPFALESRFSFGKKDNFRPKNGIKAIPIRLLTPDS
ncbi:hypothetical protein [Okeania sp. KiyG1]|nr:hypothetical protein [Okeania sp. KiyG1]